MIQRLSEGGDKEKSERGMREREKQTAFFFNKSDKYRLREVDHPLLHGRVRTQGASVSLHEDVSASVQVQLLQVRDLR